MAQRPKAPEDDPSASSSAWWAIGRFGNSDWEPPVDVMASADAVWIRVAAPGVTVDDIRVRVRGRSVSVYSRRVVRRPPRGAEFIRAEIPLGAFERRIELPWECHPHAVRLRTIDGIVELLLARLGADSTTLASDEEDDDGR